MSFKLSANAMTPISPPTGPALPLAERTPNLQIPRHDFVVVAAAKEEQFLFRLSPEQLEQVASMKDSGSALYLLSMDYGSVLPVHPYLEPFLEPEEYQYLFRRGLVGLSNPHNLEAAAGLTCGRHFVLSGAVCGGSVYAKEALARSKCDACAWK